MKKQRDGIPELIKSISMPNCSHKLPSLSEARHGGSFCRARMAIAILIGISVPVAVAQNAPSQPSNGVTIRGTVLDAAGKLVDDATVRLERKGVPGAVETKTDAAGVFAFSSLETGAYVLSAMKSGLDRKSTRLNSSHL